MVGSEAAAAGAGGSLHGGEGLRLKLQTPLYVADALMEAARARLDAQTAAAKRELASLESVRQQLTRFKVCVWVGVAGARAGFGVCMSRSGLPQAVRVACGLDARAVVVGCRLESSRAMAR